MHDITMGDSPVPGLPNLHVVYVGYPDYVQLIVEFTSFVLVTDAPAHRSHIVIDWVAENLHKPIKYIVPSHHHRDHAGGIADYVRAGSTIVVPDFAMSFYELVNGGNVSFHTYSIDSPFISKDEQADIQFRSMASLEAPHARDWTYAVVSAACANGTTPVVAYNADVWSPTDNDKGMHWDMGYARQWLKMAEKDGLSRNAIVVGTHGSTKNGTSTTEKLEVLIDVTGYDYPNIGWGGWKAGGRWC